MLPSSPEPIHPSTLASDTFYQTYLVDGLARWNQDIAVAATSDRKEPHSYSGILCHTANTLGEKVLGKNMVAYTQIHWGADRFGVPLRSDRGCIVNNARVMQETDLMLPVLSHATLTQWYSKHLKAQEKSGMEQGISAPDPPMAEPERLPSANQKRPLETGYPCYFTMPPITVGAAQIKRRRTAPSDGLPATVPAADEGRVPETPPPQAAVPSVPGTSVLPLLAIRPIRPALP
ncbi:hypothetical protein J4Q44_G00131470 [Coregonus suidteri]|uniref:Uncharacterized protein n=1 Tax=Coregonus suidteri TaxID=861788 RepID=A0AAN8LRU2_9TELE